VADDEQQEEEDTDPTGGDLATARRWILNVAAHVNQVGVDMHQVARRLGEAPEALRRGLILGLCPELEELAELAGDLGECLWALATGVGGGGGDGGGGGGGAQADGDLDGKVGGGKAGG